MRYPPVPWRSHWATRVTVAVDVGTRSAISRYGTPSLEQERGLPAVGERLELGQRAEVAEKALHLVARAQREDRVGERRRDPGPARRAARLGASVRSVVAPCSDHVSMLSC